ncbi:radical SAM protein [Acidiphilium sp. AL]|uniref:radical SAM protein n=1 Tax=Acidiphilium sp. AL TaxID=2871704 RepID=UPI0021CB67C4|nr:radical SAM protein [Acidiphilium sp. AL]MCU4158702.1 radical SAM protein [Acidiphilium sp. AL]
MPDATAFALPSDMPVIHADEPVLAFGGSYSNLQATEALLAAADRHGIPPARIICTGDVIAYGADPRATLDRLRGAGVAIVMGNCEEQLAAGAADCGCGFVSGSACDRLSAAWFDFAAARITDEARRFMAMLPRRIDLIIGGRRLAIVHGAPSRINRFLFASDDDAGFAAEIALAGTDGVIGGHCGLGFTRIVGGRIWHNAGAIGLPANDGTSRGWYSILTPRRDGFSLAVHPLGYDYRAAAAAMRAAGLPEDYADAIETGIWPSFDILPIAEQAATATPLSPEPIAWPETAPAASAGLSDSPPASVELDALETLWFNTGTLCNIACEGCYIESNPRNDRLIYLTRAAFETVLDEAAGLYPGLREIGFTGGEPFMNPDIVAMIGTALTRGYRALVLTNAMRPMRRHGDALRALRAAHGQRLAIRVSLDHYTQAGHERLRGDATWTPAIDGLRWLAREGFALSVAARLDSGTEDEAAMRAGFAALFNVLDIPIDASDPAAFVLFPEMTGTGTVPIVTETAWRAMRRRGRDAMCRTSRMVVHRKGSAMPEIVSCTLLPYEERFSLGTTLREASRAVTIDHRHCAQFCVFGGASCSGAR